MRQGAGAGGQGSQTLPGSDPWKAWVFEIDMSADFSGEQNYRNREIEGEFSANRTTADWKVELESRYDYSSERAIDQDFDSLGTVVEADTIYDRQRSWGTELIVVKSLTNHWSTGIVSSIGSETFRNQKLRVEFTPAIVEFSRRTLRRSRILSVPRVKPSPVEGSTAILPTIVAMPARRGSGLVDLPL